MRIAYDNSAENPRNPHVPPRRVTGGNRSTDEMGNVWFQLLPDSPADLPALKLAGSRHAARHERSFVAYYNLGTELQSQGLHAEALPNFENALRVNSEHALLQHNYAGSLAATGQLDRAVAAMRESIRLDPNYPNAHLNLGHFMVMRKDYHAAVASYRRTLELEPGNQVAATKITRVIKTNMIR